MPSISYDVECEDLRAVEVIWERCNGKVVVFRGDFGRFRLFSRVHHFGTLGVVPSRNASVYQA